MPTSNNRINVKEINRPSSLTHLVFIFKFFGIQETKTNWHFTFVYSENHPFSSRYVWTPAQEDGPTGRPPQKGYNQVSELFFRNAKYSVPSDRYLYLVDCEDYWQASKCSSFLFTISTEVVAAASIKRPQNAYWARIKKRKESLFVYEDVPYRPKQELLETSCRARLERYEFLAHNKWRRFLAMQIHPEWHVTSQQMVLPYRLPSPRCFRFLIFGKEMRSRSVGHSCSSVHLNKWCFAVAHSLSHCVGCLLNSLLSILHVARMCQWSLSL